jgi:hypothetical protein
MIDSSEVLLTNWKMFIRNRQHWLAVCFLSASACIGTHTPQPRTGPENLPEVPTPRAAAARKGQWNVRYTEQSISYRITRTGVIQRSDSTPQRENSTNITHEKITLGFLPGDTTTFTISAIADSFVTTTQGRIGSVAPAQLPIEVSAILSDSGLKIVTAEGDTICSPATSVVATDLHTLFPTLPTPLSSGLRWQDSTQRRGCQGGIPTTSETTRFFTVIGEVDFRGKSAIEIEGTDSTTSEGQGLQQQHQMSLSMNGTGHSTYVVEPSTGHVIQLHRVQTMTISIKAEGRETRFVQTVEQEFDAVP